MMIEKLEACPSCCEVKRWLYDAQLCASCGYGDRFRQDTRHDCVETTQEFRIQNDREWKAKVDWQKARVETLRAALEQARREYGAFGTLSGETLVQMDNAINAPSSEDL